MGCFSGRLMSAASDQKLFCKLCSLFCHSFDEFVEEKMISPSYFSAILTPPPCFDPFNQGNYNVVGENLDTAKVEFQIYYFLTLKVKSLSHV